MVLSVSYLCFFLERIQSSSQTKTQDNGRVCVQVCVCVRARACLCLGKGLIPKMKNECLEVDSHMKTIGTLVLFFNRTLS